MIIFEYLTDLCGVKKSDIILFGISVGSGPATYLASLKKVYSLILMSAFTSIRDACLSYNVLSKLASIFVVEKFNNIDLIAKIKCPCLFIHGIQDEIVPI